MTNMFSTINQETLKTLINDDKDTIIMAALDFIIHDTQASHNFGCITLEEMHHIRNMMKYKKPMEQLGIKKDYWDLTDDDVEQIAMQIAQNNGYDVW